MKPLKEFKVDALQVAVYDTEAAMGKAAAADVAEEIVRLQKLKDEINIIFAAAVSQNEFLDRLCEYEEIDWTKINVFHMDEYYGLPQNDRRSLSSFLRSHFLDRVSVKNRFFMNGACTEPEEECRRYGQLLDRYPCDLAFLGIGDNGHLAFNDPHVADFNDEKMVKMVDIDQISKQQQVNAGNFPDLQSVPSMAFTLTIPTLMKSKKMFCVVPTDYKAKAVYNTLNGPISEECPASVLRGYENAKLYLDRNSAKLLKN